jgi:intracellular septation protein
LTIWLHNETFIKWKPTGLYWAFALAFLLSQVVWDKCLLKTVLGEQLVLPDAVWRRLTFAWVGFFSSMGLINLWVAYHFETATWVNFKVFGATGLMLVFTIGQGLYINKYLPDESPTDGSKG